MQVTERTYGSLNPGERVALQFLLRKMLERDEA
jgi:MarR family transcriptional regulator, lower aerobic nicotinate degradation pathway regulator